MKMNNSKVSAMGNNQQGAVLIVVLLFLILITLAGVMSVKNSNTDLRVATSDQINTVLLQAADNVNSKLEQAVNASQTSTSYDDLINQPTGIVFHYLNDTNASEDRVSFCFKPRQKNFTKNSVTIKRGTITFLDNDGYCDPSSLDDYTGTRGTTMTQVTMNKVKKNTVDSKAFDHEAEGVDSNSKTVGKAKFDFYSTSILPAFGSPTASDITTCLEKTDELDTNDVDGDGDTTEINRKAALTCMNNRDIVAKQVVERVEIKQQAISEFCNKFGGAASNSASTSSLC